MLIKKARDAKQQVLEAKSSHPSRKNIYTSPVMDKFLLKNVGK